MKKILILGGSGFIGKNLVEYFSSERFSRRYEVYFPSRKELDLLDTGKVNEYFERKHFDMVLFAITTGNYRSDDPSQELFKKNLKIFFNVIANKESFDRMIFLGSGAEYDRSGDIVDVKETDFGKRIPTDDYGFYKYVCSRYIENSDNILNLRLFGVFGKHEDYSKRFISNIMCRIIFDLPVEMNQNAYFDYVFVEDLCRLIEYLMEHDVKHKVYNVGPSRHTDLLHIAQMIKGLSGKDVDILIRKDGMNKEYTCDSRLLLSELKDFRFTELDVAIKELYDWYQSNKENLSKTGLI